jgi:signal transduction histidine kinase/CheY-like chemotaxis protein
MDQPKTEQKPWRFWLDILEKAFPQLRWRFFLISACLLNFLLILYGILILISFPSEFFLRQSVFVLAVLSLMAVLWGMVLFLCRESCYKESLLKNFAHPGKGIIITDHHGNILYKNSLICSIFPKTKPHIKVFFEHIWPDCGSVDSFLQKQDLSQTLPLKTWSETKLFRTHMKKLSEGWLLWTITDPDWDFIHISNPIFDSHPVLRYLDLKYLFDQAPAGDVIVDSQGVIQCFNKTFQNTFLKDQRVLIGTPFGDLLDKKHEKENNILIFQWLQKEEKAPLEIKFSWGEQAILYVSPLDVPVKGAQSEKARYYFLQVFDNTQQKTLQERVVQSQKLQAMGQLAGGIAHDFNNLLTAMIGFCDLLLSRHSPNDHSFTDIMQIKQNANRAANLVRQLLAFSRQQSLQPKVMDIAAILSDVSVLLQRLIGPSIPLKIIHQSDLGLVKVDQGQFEQVIINLVVNARDAIGENGTITIQTKNRTFLRATTLGTETIFPGSYVFIEVSDDGCGIDKEDMSKIFDPFYSTKSTGEGTGLGLSTVYGIVKQTGGYIVVESTLKQGTKFSIYLPHHDEKLISVKNDGSSVQERDLTGEGKILLVEDEDSVRLFSARALRDKGYEVVEAYNGLQGLDILKKEAFDLLITDVVMPEMGGSALANHANELYPKMPIIFVSGYAEDSFRQKLHQDQEMHFLPKPFSLKVLASKVKDVMEYSKNPSIEKAS